MNLPNKLSLLRIVLVPVMAVLYLVGDFWSVLASVIVFIIACFTDFLDGYIARHTNQVTDLGKLLDPIADKTLVCFGLFLVVESHCLYGTDSIVPFGAVAFCAAIIISRELLVSAVRQIGASKGVIIHANKWGKIKAVFQYIAIPLLMLLSVKDSLSGVFFDIIYWTGLVTFVIATILTIVSGVIYVIQNKTVFKTQEVKQPEDTNN